MQKLKSRKFLLAVFGALSIYLSDAFGIDLSAEAIFGIAGILASWIGIEGVVDKKAVEGQIAVARDEAVVQLRAYAEWAQQQLEGLADADE